jgi:PPOX class probable FMN-dependent enzyme
MTILGRPIATLEELRELYLPVLERARLKTQTKLDKHCRAFIEKSPFLTLSTQGPEGADVTPRGDAPGFVHILDDHTLAIPDWRGNNRLDSLTNVLSNPKVGLLFFIPGVTETLRVNGAAVITADPEILHRWTVNNNHPATALLLTVHEAFLHCGKALIRSKLWHDDHKAPMPPYGQMLKDQIDIPDTAAEMQSSIEDAYKNKLY